MSCRCRVLECAICTPNYTRSMVIKTATPEELMRSELVRELVREVQDILYIGQCLCDRGYTSRNLHEPNTYCGQLDDLQDAVKKFEVKK